MFHVGALLKQLRRRKGGSHAEDGVYAALTLALDSTFDTGETRATPVDDSDYQVPFKFTGKIDKLTIKVTPPVLTPEDEKRLNEQNRVRRTTNKSLGKWDFTRG